MKRRPLMQATAAALAIVCLGGLPLAHAQGFPAKPVKLVIAFPAGGPTDITMRSLADNASRILGQPVIVENKPGANGAIGTVAAIRAPADGYTLLATASSVLTINPLVYRNLAYDVGRDLAPLSRTGLVPNVVVVNPSVQATDIASLIALARSKPNALNYASQGLGSNGQLNAELFRQRTGIEMTHVPYKGSAPAVTDMLSGQVQVMFDNLPTVLEQIRGGQLRALAVTTAQRTPLLPDVPTIAESGFAGFDTSAWFALMVSKATPEPVRADIERAVVLALKDPDVQTRLRAVGITPLGEGSAELAARIAAETAMWQDVIGKAGIKVD